MDVLVMGGTQFNGLALVHELVRNGHVVTVLNRGKTAATLPRDVRRLTADRTDAATLRAALAGREYWRPAVHAVGAAWPVGGQGR